MNKKILDLNTILYLIVIVSIAKFFYPNVNFISMIFNAFNIGYDVVFALSLILNIVGLVAAKKFVKGTADRYSIERTESQKEDKLIKIIVITNYIVLLIFSLLLTNFITALITVGLIVTEIEYERIRKDVEIKLAVNSLSEGV